MGRFLGAHVQVWRVRFELGSEDPSELGQRLAELARAVASAEAFGFQERLRSELLQLGARPGNGFSLPELLLDSEEVVEEGMGLWWLVIVLLLLGLGAGAFLVLRRGAKTVAHHVAPRISKALWQLESERWALAEKVLQAGAAPSMPSQWQGQWVSSHSETKVYDLTFGPGGRLEGLADAPSAKLQVSGAYDVTDGNVRWREVTLGRPSSVLEVYGQWEGLKIDGFFASFDVSTLPEQTGQGHFALSAKVAKAAKPTVSVTSLTSASPGHSDMV